ncbi:trace amine-associated receptor 13c-like [Corythoichthys intestinalis]|uniref:trace amine-associated receptor 13c-like n=1 Tax=Corythoichthys intestinalis TaxID=161448 RepID=UPI0025A59297|nr:trace amine-associated receptor 13c-like [Corythoichthys intestinalis]XP_057709073.1 trace amine-associated receptor 13c-like [Corythoichthys intestinalis]XP_061799687.1 trace amine-associated receptor 13c-like [Nerophis lumbriciformis]XP_061799692.1 trace amine-associated receptor 13c-like [Nerophis lumbriciformis]
MDTDEQSDLCFPQLGNISCRKPKSDWSQSFLFIVLLPTTCIFTVLLNLLVVISISHFRQLYTPTNLLLLSLAVSDVLVGLVGMPIVITKSISCWFLGDIACSLMNYLIFICQSASVGNMVLISADRFVAICDPLHYTAKVTVKKIKICICLCWCAAVIHCGIVLREELAHPENGNTCLGECVYHIDIIGGILDVIVNFLLPLGIIVILYTRVFVVAVSQARATRSRNKCVELQHSVLFRAKKSELKAAKTLGIVVLVFLMCFCPYNIVSLMAYHEIVMNYVGYLYIMNSCVNPLIYAVFYPCFRRAFKHIVTLRVLQPGSCNANIL